MKHCGWIWRLPWRLPAIGLWSFAADPVLIGNLRPCPQCLVGLEHSCQISIMFHRCKSTFTQLNWLVVWNCCYFPRNNWESHHPNWRTIFFRGVAEPPIYYHQDHQEVVFVGCCSNIASLVPQFFPGEPGSLFMFKLSQCSWLKSIFLNDSERVHVQIQFQPICHFLCRDHHVCWVKHDKTSFFGRWNIHIVFEG